MPTWDEPVQASAGAVGGAIGGGAAAAMGASLNTKDVNSMASEARKMLDSARSGGFRVSEDAAKPIRDVLARMLTRVERSIADIDLLSAKQPTLGGHDYGQKVALHQQEAISSSQGSPLTVLRQLADVLVDADQALKIAVDKYKEVEASASDSFRSGQV